MEGDPIEDVISERDNLLEIVVNVALLSAGINILVTADSRLQTALGVVLIGVSVVILIRSKLLKINETVEFEAALAYDDSENELLEIPEYEFSKTFKRNLEGAISEENDIEAIWTNRPISDQSVFDTNNGPNKTTSLELSEEMFEYILLDKLSTATTDYFNGTSVEIKQYNRNEIPNILLENRFVGLFSKPMEDRAAFQEMSYSRDEELPENVVSKGPVFAFGEDGEMFRHFQLTLPKDCDVSRDENGCIVIESRAVTIRLSTSCEGFATVLDSDVLKLNDNIDGRNGVNLKMLESEIDIEIGYISLVKNIGRQYKWVDKYIRMLERDISLERYKEDMEIPQLKLAAKLTAKQIQNQKSE